MILEVKRLSKSFGGLMALNDLSFSINEEEVVGLICPNGSGKSTAFNVITGLFPTSSGEINFRLFVSLFLLCMPASFAKANA